VPRFRGTFRDIDVMSVARLEMLLVDMRPAAHLPEAAGAGGRQSSISSAAHKLAAAGTSSSSCCCCSASGILRMLLLTSCQELLRDLWQHSVALAVHQCCTGCLEVQKMVKMIQICRTGCSRPVTGERSGMQCYSRLPLYNCYPPCARGSIAALLVDGCSAAVGPPAALLLP